MKAKHRKQRRKNAIGKSSPKLMPPAPLAEGEPTDKQIPENLFHLPIYQNMLRLMNPADQHSKFIIEGVMMCHRIMGVNLSYILPKWIKEAAALQASERATVTELINKGKLISPGWPPLLKPEVWIAAWFLIPEALAEVNAVYPGAIYTVPEFVKAIRTKTFVAANGDMPEKRNTANDWLRTVFAVSPPQRKLPQRRDKKKLTGKSGRSPRSLEIRLSSIHIWSIYTLYQDIVKARKVYVESSRSKNKLFSALPELLDVQNRKPEWFKKIVPVSLPYTRPIDAACEIIASIPESGLQGHKKVSIRKAFDRLSRKTKLNFIPKLEKFSRDGGKKIVEEFKKRAAEASPNVTP